MIPRYLPLILSLFSFAALSGLSAQMAGDSPVKIFIMIGQSNMLGKGEIAGATTQGTLEYIVANDPGGDYQFLQDGSSNWVVRDDVWIRDQDPNAGGLTVGYGGEASGLIGPELGFGHLVGDLYEEQVLIVKCAWGGKSLGNDFLPPSSGPYPTPVAAGDTGFYYQEVLRLVGEAIDNLGTYFPDYNAAGGYEIAGICWHQGWNDRVLAGFDVVYEANLANLIRDIRTDLGVPELPFVIATSAMDGNGPDVYSLVELAQRAMTDPSLTDPSLPNRYDDFIGNVAVIDCRTTYDGMDFWIPAEFSPANEGFHWNRNALTYLNIGLAMGDAMSSLAPPRCPSRLRANGDPGGILLTWQNGLETPTSVEVIRDAGVLSAAAPVDPSTFLDTTALPGVYEYQINFTMPGEPCDPLTVTFDGGIANMEAYRVPTGVGLTWENKMTYSAIELKRDGVVIAPSLPGGTTSYIDTSPPPSGSVVYTAVPTTGTTTPATAEINLDGPPSGNALIYEPFDYSAGGLNLASSDTEVGLEGSWNAHSTALVTAGGLTYGDLPVGGAKLSDFTAAQNRFGGTRSIRASALAENGLLDDGATLWFSMLAGVDTGGNRSNSRIAVALSDGPFGSGNTDFFISGGTGVGLHLDNGIPRAATFPADSGGATLATNNSPQYEVGAHGLIVGKITWGATPGDPDTIELFTPGTDLAQPASPISTLTTTVDQTGYDTLTFRRGDRVLLDEIRFAASYDDVIGADLLGPPDETAPTPDPMTWESPPAAISSIHITMTANPASDPSGVEYYFTCTSGGGNDSGWQDSRTYTDSGLTPSTSYSYVVKARDKSSNLNETANSTPAASATTLTPTGESTLEVGETIMLESDNSPAGTGISDGRFNISVEGSYQGYQGSANQIGGGDPVIVNDTTFNNPVVAYRFWSAAANAPITLASDTGDSVDSPGTINDSIIGDLTTSDTAIDPRSRVDIWTTTAPNGNAFDTTPDYTEMIGNISGASGSIDITGMASGSVYIIYGAYRSLPVGMTATMGAEVIADFHNGDFANNNEYYMARLDFVNNTGETSLDWTMGEFNGRFCGIVVTSDPGTPTNPFITWSAGPFPSGNPLSNPDPTLDFDQGGMETGLEWALDGDPTDPSDDVGLAPSLDNTTDPDYFIYTFNRSELANDDPNTSIIVEYGSNLNGWTPAEHDGDDVIVTVTPGSPTDAVEVKLKRSTLAIDGKLFARLKVVVSP